MRNMDRVRKYARRLTKGHQFIQSCFSWTSPPRSFSAFTVSEVKIGQLMIRFKKIFQIFLLVVYYFELYMVPLAVAISLLLAYLEISIARGSDETCDEVSHLIFPESVV